jgi:hypothetical protein
VRSTSSCHRVSSVRDFHGSSFSMTQPFTCSDWPIWRTNHVPVCALFLSGLTRLRNRFRQIFPFLMVIILLTLASPKHFQRSRCGKLHDLFSRPLTEIIVSAQTCGRIWGALATRTRSSANQTRHNRTSSESSFVSANTTKNKR